jgi:hypothetical protein
MTSESIVPPEPVSAWVFPEIERPTQYEIGVAAGLAGKPAPDGATAQFLQGFARGSVQRRAQNGEVIGVFTTATKCTCGEMNWGFRAGCRCNTSFEDLTVTWGALVWGDTPDAEMKFMSSQELLDASKIKPVLDMNSGQPVSFE